LENHLQILFMQWIFLSIQSLSGCSFFENSHNLIYMYRNFIYISYVCVFTGALLVGCSKQKWDEKVKAIKCFFFLSFLFHPLPLLLLLHQCIPHVLDASAPLSASLSGPLLMLALLLLLLLSARTGWQCTLHTFSLSLFHSSLSNSLLPSFSLPLSLSLSHTHTHTCMSLVRKWAQLQPADSVFHSHPLSLIMCHWDFSLNFVPRSFFLFSWLSTIKHTCSFLVAHIPVIYHLFHCCQFTCCLSNLFSVRARCMFVCVCVCVCVRLYVYEALHSCLCVITGTFAHPLWERAWNMCDAAVYKGWFREGERERERGVDGVWERGKEEARVI